MELEYKSLHVRVKNKTIPRAMRGIVHSALGESRTPNRLIRSQVLYPLSYERWLP